MSLTFDFPGFHKQFDAASCPDTLPPPEKLDIRCASDWACDLQDLSGEESGDEQQIVDPMPAQQQQEPDAAVDAAGEKTPKKMKLETSTRGAHGDHFAGSSCGQDMPGAVLLLVVDGLCLRDAMSAACCCTSWHDAIISNNSSTWEQQEKSLLGGLSIHPFIDVTPVAEAHLSNASRLCKTVEKLACGL
jgi:hypothetical protein